MKIEKAITELSDRELVEYLKKLDYEIKEDTLAGLRSGRRSKKIEEALRLEEVLNLPIELFITRDVDKKLIEELEAKLKDQLKKLKGLKDVY